MGDQVSQAPAGESPVCAVGITCNPDAGREQRLETIAAGNPHLVVVDDHPDPAELQMITNEARRCGTHVIEHLREPVQMIGMSWSRLKAGRRLVCLTPNVEGVGRRVFGGYWHGLGPPRHLFVFSRRTLGIAAKEGGLHGYRLWTSVSHVFTLSYSRLARSWGAARRGSTAAVVGMHVAAALIQFVETVAHLVLPSSGDECVLWAVK